MTTFVIIYSISDYTTIYSTCNKVVLIAFSISDIFCCNNLCYFSCDFHGHVIKKDNDFYYYDQEI